MDEPVVLLLNNDVKLDPDAVGPLARAFDDHADALFAAPLVLDFRRHDVTRGCGRGSGPGSAWSRGCAGCRAIEARIDQPDLTAAAGPVLAVDRAQVPGAGRLRPDLLPRPDRGPRPRLPGLDGGLEGVLRARVGRLSPRLRLVRAGVRAGRLRPAGGAEHLLFAWKNLSGPRLAGHLAWLPVRLAHRRSRRPLDFARGSLRSPGSAPRGDRRRGERWRSGRRGWGDGRRRFSSSSAGNRWDFVTKLRSRSSTAIRGTASRRGIRRRGEAMARTRPRPGHRRPPARPARTAGRRTVQGRPVSTTCSTWPRRLERSAGRDPRPSRRARRRSQPLGGVSAESVRLAPGPPPEGAAILRTDRLYDPARLRRGSCSGTDPESAVIWRLDRPASAGGADDELTRRQYLSAARPILGPGPGPWLARLLCRTPIRPNAVTLASGVLVLGGVATGRFARGRRAGPLAAGVGRHGARAGARHGRRPPRPAPGDELGLRPLARRQARRARRHGPPRRDRLVGLRARTVRPAWLGVGMLYAMGKYLFALPPRPALDPR